MIDGTSVVLLIPSAADELGAGRNGLLDPGRDPIGLAREDKRPDLGFGQEGIADPQAFTRAAKRSRNGRSRSAWT